MELLLTLLVLYAAEGLLFLPPDAFAFSWTRRGGAARRRMGRDAGVSSLPLRPGALTLFAAPPPLALEGDRIRTTAPVGALGLPAPRAAAPWLDRAALAPIEVAGKRVRASGAAFVRGASRRHARDLAALLARLVRTDTEERRSSLADAWTASADPAPLRERVDAARAALRTSALVCDAYALTLFVGVPALLVATDADRTLWIALGIVALLHGAALVSARAAHRALLPSDDSGRREALLAAAIYPPSLLRLPQRIFLEATGVPLPATAAAALLAGEARVHFLRRALAESDHDASALPGDRDALLRTLAGIGIEAGELRRAPERADPSAVAWCPRCFEQFRPGRERCTDCDVALRGYAP